MISIILRGDFRFFYPENITNFAIFPSAWDASLNTGIGKSALSSLWINSYLNFTAIFTKLGLSWDVIGLIFWILPPIFLSFFSAFYLFNTLFPERKPYAFLSGLIYLFNTYFLMVFTGGQLGVALAYSLAPLVFLGFVRVIRDCRLRDSIITGVLLALQILFDPRITFITILAVGLYWLFFRKNIIFVFLIPSLLAALLHSYWVLPLFLTKLSPIPADFDSLAGFQFFSFADFSHALSLLHPNWPENIFGKIYFLQPEFLVLPILAYSSLLFINKKTQGTILFFALLGLVGTFLAKGVNPPFGEINTWLFQFFPGMNMFRDPTKFYTLTTLSYSILIPFSLYHFTTWINSKLQFKIQNVFLLVVACYLLLLIRSLWLGDLKEKFKPREIPVEYVQLKDFLVSQPEFFRTLWIPQWQRFGFFSNNHPAIGRNEILKSASASGQIKELSSDSSKELLKNLGVKYVIVPYDSEGEIFLDDRKYDNNQYLKTIGELKRIKWLKQLNCSIIQLFNCYGSDPFGKIAVFEVPNPKDHFWSLSDLGINYSFISPTEYKVEVKNAQKGDLLVFSESFNEDWQAQINELQVNSELYKDLLNSFILPREGNYVLKVYYEPQQWVNTGLAISGITVLATLALLGLGRLRKI